MAKKYKKGYINSFLVNSAETEYTVEKIIDKQVNPVTGVTEYLLKWKGYSDKDNTWEPEHYLDCPNLVAEFEANRKRKNEFYHRKRKYTATITSDAYKHDGKKRVIGFARGFQPEQILAATNSSGQLLFLMKWANTNKVDLVPAVEANIRCPQIVIDFYERHIVLLNPVTAKEPTSILRAES
ncbi:hypothetical protein RN001_010569 [Aquatica leii]|uniref:Chromo domain-containing protein n=1 Tax=Aquatica leii TaxID=1421715 RepID=A0AAN7P816_9COLE|nr:hypothetical protein RN001_010569 [Aquatica leii]